VVRDLFVDGNITEAGNLTMSKLNRNDLGGMRMFSYFGTLNLAFGHSNNTEHYVRSLDTKTGLSAVEYTVDGVEYRLESETSLETSDSVLACRIRDENTWRASLQAFWLLVLRQARRENSALTLPLAAKSSLCQEKHRLLSISMS
jgi:hypothetical protein